MTEKDYIEVSNLWRSMPGLKLEKADSMEGVCRYLSKNPKLSFVAEIDGKVIGTVLCGEDGRRGYLQHLCVSEEYQGNNIGKLLLEAAIEQFNKLDIYEIRIFVFKNNDLGNKFWTKFGWDVRDDIFVRSFQLHEQP